jgi:hypothetical protein
MAKVRPGVPVLVVIAALLACATPTPERLLDEACRDKQCATTGSARETTGLTADSIGFELGPGPGSVTIPGGRLQFASGQLELLVKGSGSVVVTVGPPGCTGCNSHSIVLHDQWRWERVETVLELGNSGPAIAVETLDDATQAKLLDLRVR